MKCHFPLMIISQTNDSINRYSPNIIAFYNQMTSLSERIKTIQTYSAHTYILLYINIVPIWIIILLQQVLKMSQSLHICSLYSLPIPSLYIVYST